MVIQMHDIEKLPIDFEEIMDALKQRIQAKLPTKWSDFLMSNFGVELLEAVAYEAMLMNYYVNASLNECFLPTAKTKHAIHSLASTIGYKPQRAFQSIVDLQLNLEFPAKAQIFIPKYTIFSTSTGIKFYSIEDALIEKNSTSTNIKAKSGIVVMESIVSNAIPRYRYKLQRSNVIKVEKVETENFSFKYVDFIDQQKREPYYTIDFDINNTAYLTFGDNIYGINPPEGMVLEVLYIVNNTELYNNNNVLPNSINTIDSVLYDANSEIVTDMSVTNLVAASGGAPEETLDEIKRNAPSIYRTQQRAVTRQDFKDLVIARPNIEKVSIIDHYNMEEVGIFGVKVCPIQLGGGYMSHLAKEELFKYLEDKKIISTQVSIIDPSYITFDVSLVLQANQSANINILTNAVRKQIIDFMSWKNREFGQSVSLSELKRTIFELPDVLNIYTLDMEENRRIKISKIFYENSDSTNKIMFNDSINILRVGSKIMIANKNNEIKLKAIIGSIDLNGLVVLSENITKDMKIEEGCEIYPMQRTFGNYKFGDKEIALRHEYVYEDEKFYYELKEEHEHLLSNLIHCSIYFENHPSEIYTILARSGENIYLNRPLSHNVEDGEYVFIKFKKAIPVLGSVSLSGSNQLKFKDYPRFSRNTTLTSYDYNQYENTIYNMIKSHNESDHIDVFYDMTNVIEVVKVYSDYSHVFVENTDFIFERNKKQIKWTELGLEKIEAGKTFYVEVIRKLNVRSDKTQTFNVSSVVGKTVTVSPVVKENIYENTMFSYESDTYNLLPNEIADIGNIDIEIV